MSAETDTTAALVIAVALAAAVAMAGGRSDPPVDCVLDRQALEHAEPDQWTDWPACLEPERDIYIDDDGACMIDGEAGGWHHIPYCADIIGDRILPMAGT